MADTPPFSATQHRLLIDLARTSIARRFDATIEPPPCPDAAFTEKRGAFVTLTVDGHLRGCIGRIEAVDSLWNIVGDMAEAAAFKDPRFPSLSSEEFDNTQIEISVLSPLEPVNDIDSIIIGKHGLLIRKGPYSGLLLPQVASSRGWDVKMFLQETCRKAGLKRDDWINDAEILMFSAEVFGEEDVS